MAPGLFLATFATLVLETLDSRLLSVLTWYHLAFLAVSVAMLGMAAGAVLVFVDDARFGGERGAAQLPRYATYFALSIPLSHLGNLCLPIPLLEQFSVMEVTAITLSTVILAVPFVLSGVVVTLGLTRTGGSIGRLYAADLLGAALGCLVFIPLIERSNITSVAFVAASAAASAAYCFSRFAGAARPRNLALLAVLFLLTGGVNALTPRGLGVMYLKSQERLTPDTIAFSAWNTHSFVSIEHPTVGPPFYWGAGRGASTREAVSAWVLIDGEAGTPITRWSGQREDLDWVASDVTTLPYHLRRGAAGVIGVGGGRDILSALWGQSTHVTAIELNGNLLRALRGPFRDFARLADQPNVTLVHGEARSVLSRGERRFDVLQMSLIDTWAATGAGAFTLSENGLYTLDGWRVFLGTLAPGGVFSVSRWFSSAESSETSRLLGLGVAALLERGVQRPSEHLLMLASGQIATLLVSNQPFTADDRARVEALVASEGFTELVVPWATPSNAFLAGIVAATSRAQLEQAVAHEVFDFTPPTDERPFFFNTLKPASFWRAYVVTPGGVISGNLRATFTLVLLFFIALGLVLAIIGAPLVRSGLPKLGARAFALAVAYFALIGFGYMLIQVPLLQRFSVYLGHPTYAFAVILFSMIFFTGVGSFLSDRFPPERLLKLPALIGLAVFALTALLQPVMDATIHLELPARALTVVACTAPLALLLGFCFPLGMRLVGRLSSDATAWMWGVNGASGVLASIVAVALSMWAGIDTNLLLAGGLYLLLLLPAHALAARGLRPAP